VSRCVKCGNRGLFLKVDDTGICAACVQFELKAERDAFSQKYDELHSRITPEMRECIDLNELVDSLRENVSELRTSQTLLKSQLSTAQTELKNVQNQLVVAKDAIELETFSLYEPKYRFMNSDDLKKRLLDIRANQKDWIKEGIAAYETSPWTVDGSRSKGERLSKNMIKLLLRSFNNECDIAIASVRFNNYDRCEARIEKAYETLNKLCEALHVTLAYGYVSTKLAELEVAHEYEERLSEEKEERKALRAEERERAKLEKEIEEARRAAEKERKHYEQAMKAVQVQIAACKTAAELTELQKKQSEISAYMNAVNAKLADIDYRQANQKAGYVYIISNIGSFGEGVYKIGMTRRLDPTDRIDELGDASVPFYFDIHAMIFSNDAPKLEAALHKAFESRRLNKVNARREYFHVTLDEIKDVVRRNFDKTVEFIDAPIAEQYRESMRMSEVVSK